MCLIAFAWQAQAGRDLVVAANRDEFHARPTEAAHWWAPPERLFGGRDRQAGGAWCAADARARFAAVTNVRDHSDGTRSRGWLVRDYFRGDTDATAWADHCAREGADYRPFNLLVGDRDTLWFVSNRGDVRHLQLTPGVYAISNGHWHERWPKTEYAAARLRRLLDADAFDAAAGFELLADAEPAVDAALPDTGIGIERERLLSPLFIQSPDYGTRASSVIVRTPDGATDFHEHGFDAKARVIHRVHEHWATGPEP